ncbi:MAG TPA: leucine-rich repeat domain-containing protein [Longimicrobiales bacterium]|nr:leucine-rich repeat domain-containing protein [Longimicrobiales bacterium]
MRGTPAALAAPPPHGVLSSSNQTVVLSLLCTVVVAGCDSAELAGPDLHPDFAVVAGSPAYLVSGGGTVVTPFGLSTYAFHASVDDAGRVKGKVELHFSSSDVRVQGNVTCLAVGGSEAWLGAVVTRSDLETGNFAVGGDFVWRASDNGEGADADAPDRVSSFFGNPAADFCNARFEVLEREWSNGNVQITTPGSARPGDSQLCLDDGSDGIARFSDPNFEAAVRSALGLAPEQEITCELAASLQNLIAGNAGITSLDGAQNLTGLLLAELGGNSITDISPLTGLSSMWGLGLFDNDVSDITPLASLTGLTFLEISGNRVSDLSPLSGLVTMDFMRICGNAFDDISDLAPLVNLRVLCTGANSLTDVSAVAGMTNLEELSLVNTPSLSNIQPLLDNPGLGAGDRVDLNNTGVSCSDVAALEAKGVTVFSGC